MAEQELELIQEMYSKYVALPSEACITSQSPLNLDHQANKYRLVSSCTSKCIPKEYREGELNKGESVCIDRCVSKYMETNLKIGEKMQSDAQGRAGAGAGAAPGPGGMFGR